MNVENERLVAMYRTMVRIRVFEERTVEKNNEGKIPRHVHCGIGQEAVPTGAMAVLRPDDMMFSGHRGQGYVLAKGGRPDRLMAELYGKVDGYCKGKGGSMHVADVSTGNLGTCGLVGGTITFATGVALSIRARHEDKVVLCFPGDGAANEGRFHEGINLASVWRLPVVFVCENNLYAISVHQRSAMAIENIADRAIAYGIPGVVVDGMDVLAVYDAVGRAVERACRGQGPSLIECKTYRFRGHSEGDPEPYRSREEVAAWMKRDPVPAFRQKLIDAKVLSEGECVRIETEARDEMERAVQFAEESPYPGPQVLFEDVYA